MEPYEGREPYIFISYARKDAERVAPYLDALSVAGYRVWYDKGISAGDEWLKTLEDKVANCEVFCLLFSKAFNDSYYCFRETSYACWQNKKIVPLYLDEVGENLRLMFRLLKSFQYLRLDDCAPVQFAERLERQQAFEPCKAPPEWNKIGQIQWRLSVDGVLSIARNEDLPEWYVFGSIPPYQYDPVHGGSIAPWAPYREKILSLEILDNIDAIGDNAFRLCTSLTDVGISNGVTTIGNGTFALCQNLTKVLIGDRVTQIGRGAFVGCKNLTNVCIPDSVTQIDDLTFARCYSLTDVRIPDRVIKIGREAFSYCENLKSVEIPAGAEVGYNAFPDHTRVTRRKPRDGGKT